MKCHLCGKNNCRRGGRSFVESRCEMKQHRIEIQILKAKWSMEEKVKEMERTMQEQEIELAS
jgi:hypothetical protein